MNVSLAAQTLSSGVADAIEYLRKCGGSNFQGSEATTLFIRRIDEMFDRLNSRNPFGRGFKQPIRPENTAYIFSNLSEYTDYLRSLHIEGVPILQHRRKTFALGLITCCNSLYILTGRLFEKCGLNYFLTYKVSQDHIELLFNCIRGLGGWNNNPNCIQLKSAVRKVQLRSYTSPSANGNCRDLEEDVCGIFSPKSANGSTSKPEEEDVLDMLAHMKNVPEFSQNILYYIAGFVVREMLPKINCNDCRQLLVPSVNDLVEDALIDHLYHRSSK